MQAPQSESAEALSRGLSQAEHILPSPPSSPRSSSLQHQGDESQGSVQDAAAKTRMFKAFPDTRSLSAYMDEVISEFATVMEARVRNLDEVKTFLRAMMLFVHKHYTRRLHTLAVMEGKGQFDAERVQYAALVLLYELLRHNRQRLWGDECTEEEARHEAHEICRVLADRVSNVSRAGFDRHIATFEQDPGEFFEATTPEVRTLELKSARSSTGFKIDLKTAENLRSKVRPPRFSEMRMYVEGAEARARRPRRRRYSTPGERSSSSRKRQKSFGGIGHPTGEGAETLSQRTAESGASASATPFRMPHFMMSAGSQTGGNAGASSAAGRTVPVSESPSTGVSATLGAKPTPIAPDFAARLPPPVPSAVQRALEDAMARQQAQEGGYIYHQLRIMRTAQLLTKIKSGERLDANEVQEFTELNKWLLANARPDAVAAAAAVAGGRPPMQLPGAALFGNPAHEAMFAPNALADLIAAGRARLPAAAAVGVENAEQPSTDGSTGNDGDEADEPSTRSSGGNAEKHANGDAEPESTEDK